MPKIKVIDITLRDGGCVNEFNFGRLDMNCILAALNKSNVDYIELGYINAEKGAEHGRTQFSNEKVIRRHFLTDKKPGTGYVAMIDYGTFDIAKLGEREKGGIDGVRLAFHKKDADKIAREGREIIGKGYELFIQPMLTLRYTDFEFLELIDMVNTFLPDASGFYVVDSFGEMRHNDVIRAFNLVDHNLAKGMPVGFHSHNNLQMSYANAISVMQFPTTRGLFIDSSIMGMGKGAGNLNTELLLEHLNLFYNGKYAAGALLNVIDTVINRIRAEFDWGYSVEYYLSAVNRCSPSYAGYFYRKHMLPAEQISELLGKISEDKKISFDSAYADRIYREYLFHVIDDSKAIKSLRAIFSNKTVLLLAPGRSCETDKNKIALFARSERPVVVSINFIYDEIDSDYVFISNRRRYKALIESDKNWRETPLICASNIPANEWERVYTVNYSSYLCDEPDISDNGGMMVLNLLKRLNAGEVVLAGFDGFGYRSHVSGTPSENVNAAECLKLNRLIGEHIFKISKNVNISFLTDSVYLSGNYGFTKKILKSEGLR